MAMPIPSIGEKRGKHIVYTIEECASCSSTTKRPFQLKDFVYKESGECQKCKNKAVISMIYSEPIKRSQRTSEEQPKTPSQTPEEQPKTPS